MLNVKMIDMILLVEETHGEDIEEMKKNLK